MKKLLSTIAILASFFSISQNEHLYTFSTSTFMQDATLLQSEMLDNNEQVVAGWVGDAVKLNIETFNVLNNSWTTHMSFSPTETPFKLYSSSVVDTAYFTYMSTSGLVWTFSYHNHIVDTLMNGVDIGNFYANPMNMAVSGELQRLFFVFDGVPVNSEVKYYDYGNSTLSSASIVGSSGSLQNTNIYINEGSNDLYVVGTDQNSANTIEISRGAANATTLTMMDLGPVTNAITTVSGATADKILLSTSSNDYPDIFFRENTTEEMYSTYNDNSSTSYLGLNQAGPYRNASVGDSQNQYLIHSQSGDTYIVFRNHSSATWDTIAKNTGYLLATGYDGDLFSIDVNPLNSRLYGAYGNPTGPFSKIFLTNSAPSFQSANVLDICANSNGVIFENLELFDLDMDSLAVAGYTSSNPAVIGNNFDVFFDVISYSGNTTTFNAIASTLAPGTTDITFDFTDGMDTVSHTETITVIAPTQVNWMNTTNDLCLINNEYDLTQLVDKPTLDFFENSETVIINDGIVDGTSLVPGTNYNITVSAEDNNGCVSSSNQVFTFHNPPSITFAITDASCGANNGEVVATINSPNGSYSPTWNNGLTTETISNLVPNGYYLNVVDVLGCEITEMASVDAADITVVDVLTNPTCYGGTDGKVDLTISGSDGPYQVLWSTGSATEDALNASAGIYQAVITSASGCEITKNYVLSNPVEPSLNVTFANPTCGANDGSIFLGTPNGLTAPLTFDWSNSTSNQDLLNVASGFYSVNVEDVNGCTISEEFVLNAIDGPEVYGFSTQPDCGLNNGEVNANFYIPAGETLGGISWSHGPTTEDVTGLAPATYICTVTTTSGCVGTNAWTITSKAPQANPICIVTVDSLTTSNLIVWEKAQTVGVDYYNIYRETAQPGSYALIDTVKYDNLSVFNDVVASPKTKSWRYKISAVNDCGIEGPKSIAHKTVHLVTYPVAAIPAQMVVWDDYEGISYSSADLYRFSNENGWEFLTTVTNTEYLYEDLTAPTLTGLDYMLEITPSSVCTATENKAQDYNSSRSNKAAGIFNPGNGTGDSNNSLSEENDNFSLTVYPNPSNGILNVIYENFSASFNANISIIDLQGRVIYTDVLNEGNNTIDIDYLSSGIYTVIVNDNSTTETVKIVKR